MSNGYNLRDRANATNDELRNARNRTLALGAKRDEELKYLISWEDPKTDIVYTEPYQSSAPLLEVADLFKRQKEATYPSMSIKVKAITIQSSPTS